MTKRYAPATERNRAPLLAVLQSQLPEQGVVLEIAAGSGQHAAYFAPQLAPRLWLPTDGAANLASINEWCAEADSASLLATQHLDVLRHRVGGRAASLTGRAFPRSSTSICCILRRGLCCHGFIRWRQADSRARGRCPPLWALQTARSTYRRSLTRHLTLTQLRAENASWGIRDQEAVTDVAREAGFECAKTIAMPANNQVLVFHHQ